MRIAVVGLGSIAKKHIIAIKKIDSELILFAVRHKRNSSTERDITNISLDDLPSLGLDAIILCNPSVFHAQFIEYLIPLNIPIMVEKPICVTKDQWKTLNSIAKKKSAPIYTACNLRFHPLIQFLKNYLKKNPVKIYEVNAYCGSYLPSWRLNINYEDSYSAKKDMGGGVHFDLIHELDYLTYLFGSALKMKKNYRKVSNLKIDSIDYAHYYLAYKNFSASVILNYFRQDPKRILEIIRENDTLELNFIKGTIVDLKSKNILIDIGKEGMDLSYLNQMKYFLSFTKKNQQPMNSLEESLEIIKTIL